METQTDRCLCVAMRCGGTQQTRWTMWAGPSKAVACGVPQQGSFIAVLAQVLLRHQKRLLFFFSFVCAISNVLMLSRCVQVREWVQAAIGVVLPNGPDEIHAALKDGSVLAK